MTFIVAPLGRAAAAVEADRVRAVHQLEPDEAPPEEAMDLRARWGEAPEEPGARGRRLLLLGEPDRAGVAAADAAAEPGLVALLVGRATRVVQVEPSALCPLPPFVAGLARVLGVRALFFWSDPGASPGARELALVLAADAGQGGAR